MYMRLARVVLLVIVVLSVWEGVSQSAQQIIRFKVPGIT